VLVVLGVLGLVASWRLDQAVATAYRTDWVAPDFVERQKETISDCSNCWRLPSEPWIWAYALTGSLAILCLLGAVMLFQRRHPRATKPAAVRRLAWGGAWFVGLIVVVEFIMRQLTARGHSRGYITFDTALDALALVVLGVTLIAAAAGSPEDTEPQNLFVRRVLGFLYRQRANVLGLAFLTAALMFVGQTSGQAIDGIRTWGFDSAHSIARLGFGVGATLILSLVVYESAVQLARVSTEHTMWKQRPWWVFVAVGLVIAAIGAALVAWGPFGYGPIVVGLMIAILGVLEHPRLGPEHDNRNETPAQASALEPASVEELEEQAGYDARVSEMLAIVPLLVVASTGVAAAIDAALSRGKSNGLSPLLPTLVLAFAAVLMTGKRTPARFEIARMRIFFAAGACAALASILIVAVFPTNVAAATLSLIGCVLVFAYAWWLFRIQPPPSWTPEACCRPLSLPVIGAIGLGVLIAVHWNTFGSTDTLGTVALICLGIAFWLAVLNFFIYASFKLRPPWAFRSIGVAQLPVITLIAIAWVAAGALRTAPTLHEARLTERLPITTADGREVIPDPPTLTQAFNAWTLAQPELNGERLGTSRGPIPMFLVAAHGGGIRAAYWTALGLDCIVGVSGADFDSGPLFQDDAASREATCTSPRRTPPQQEQAARRIFLASGVSGGAMGLYAYARQLISEGSLGDGSWVNSRLGRDFASATIGWGLFHDATNHWFGLNSHPGGRCAWEIGSVCMTADRAAIQEEAFDRVWPDGGFQPLLRLTWDMRSSDDKHWQRLARMVPLLVTNATVTGGKARGVVTAANLGSWPRIDSHDPGRGDFDTHPLAGTVEVVEAACATKDLRLSTAALLGARFPYVSPSGHISGHCRRPADEDADGDESSPCAKVKAKSCEMRLVDGGYADNSGLFTIDALWPSLRQLVMNFNKSSPTQIAPVIVELDNHYQAGLATTLSAGGTGAETVVPLLTAFGARSSQETFARALAYRLRPPRCTVTISPGLHPGLTAPLGWELSKGARGDLQEGLISKRPTALGREKYRPVLDLRRLQQWLGREKRSGGLKPLQHCVPTDTFPKRK
jgi:hypothetical protein